MYISRLEPCITATIRGEKQSSVPFDAILIFIALSISLNVRPFSRASAQWSVRYNNANMYETKLRAIKNK